MERKTRTQSGIKCGTLLTATEFCGIGLAKLHYRIFQYLLSSIGDNRLACTYTQRLRGSEANHGFLEI